MKRYALLILVVFLLLLLIPLPALGILGGDKPPVSSSEGSSSGSSSPSGSSAPSADEDSFKVLDVKSGEVLEVGMRDFLIGTVASVLFPTYHIEAMKAQAVASYTYYTVQRIRQKKNPDPDLKGADFSDVPSTFPETYTQEGLKKRWGDRYDEYYKKVCEAVDAVFGKQLIYNGEPILAAYHAISFGTTEDAANVWGSGYPYLVPVPSPGDELSPDFASTVTFTPEEFSEAVKKVLPVCAQEGQADGWIGGEITRSEAGTVTAVTVGGVSCTGKQLRTALGLRSACFTVEYKNGGFLFQVKGYGHGVGMSQYGADYMARQGSDWEDILRHYYTDVEIADG